MALLTSTVKRGNFERLKGAITRVLVHAVCGPAGTDNVDVKAREFDGSKYTEYTTNATASNLFDQFSIHFYSRQGNFKEISLEYSQYLPVILQSRSKIWRTIHLGIWKFWIEPSIRLTLPDPLETRPEDLI